MQKKILLKCGNRLLNRCETENTDRVNNAYEKYLAKRKAKEKEYKYKGINLNENEESE